MTTTTTTTTTTTSRMMLPDDANPAGNVHGGTILQEMERAGIISATKWFRSGNAVSGSNPNEGSFTHHAKKKKQNQEFAAVLARFETTTFHRPVYVGNVLTVTARPIYTSARSVLLKVTVFAEDLVSSTDEDKTMTNSGLLWYTCYSRRRQRIDEDGKAAPAADFVGKLSSSSSSSSSSPSSSRWVVSPVPQIEEPTTSNNEDDDDEALLRDYLLGKSLYEQRKKTKSCNENIIVPTTFASLERIDDDDDAHPCYRNTNEEAGRKMECFCPNCRALYNFDSNNVEKGGGDEGIVRQQQTLSTSSSKQTLCRMILPSDCESRSKLAFGGAVMKEMDNAAGCAAYRHCCTTKNNVVTVSITDLDFTGFVKLGDVVTVNAELVFCSNKSMDVLVTASTYNSDNTFIDDGDDDDNIVVAKGIFTFVSLDHQTYRPLPVPMLRYESESELRRAYERQVRYETSKRQRRRK